MSPHREAGEGSAETRRVLRSPDSPASARHLALVAAGGVAAVALVAYIVAGLGSGESLSRLFSDPLGAVSITRVARDPVPVEVSYELSGVIERGQTFYSLGRGLGLTSAEIHAGVRAARPTDLTRLATGTPYHVVLGPAGRPERFTIKDGETWLSVAWRNGQAGASRLAHPGGDS